MSSMDVLADFGLDDGTPGLVEKLIWLAKTAENAERYEDMCKIMKSLVEKGPKSIEVEVRNLLSVAYKNVVGVLRASLRQMNQILEESSEGARADMTAVYKKQIQGEIKVVCNELIDLLKNDLIPEASDDEAKVFFLKMGADYYRYLAECLDKGDADSADNKDNAQSFYEQAYDLAKAGLPPTHPIRLGLALNYSVCQYEIIRKPDMACQLAKEAFDNAIAQLDKLEESDYKDSTLIMQLLRDNLTLWTAADDNDDEDEN